MKGAEKKTPELSKEQNYEFGNGKVSFIVTPIFRTDGERTVAAALLRLMKQETERYSGIQNRHCYLAAERGQDETVK